MGRYLTLAAILSAVFVRPSAAHPVPKDTHDRTLVVHLEPDQQPGRLAVRVTYRLEVDELTAFTKDLEPYDIDVFQYRGKGLELYRELARRLGTDLAFRMNGKVNGERLAFACASQGASLHDEKGTPLGHLRCDFELKATAALRTGQDNELAFRDHSYLGEEGKIDLSLVAAPGLTIVSKSVPDEAVKQRALREREPGDDDRLRELRAVYTSGDAPPAEAPLAERPTAASEGHDDYSLLRLFLHSDYGFWLTLLMATVFGAAHALTPGHGKTLVAAYLVGERGTMFHALVLGIVTTLTHTGVVLAMAGVLFCLPPDARTSFGATIQNGLGLAMGLLVMCLGFWLLLQRLSGRADHFHVGGGQHHHHHYHHHHHAAEPAADGESAVRWWGLIVLGMTGGLVPCWDAIVLLMAAVGRSELLLAFPMVLAFSAGLAGVLVLIGVLVVQVPKFARSRWGNGRVVRALPIVSAAIVTLMGLWLCYEGVRAP
jgi:ABC-type nickel/cobalt efflux system permease component RcnA